MKKRVVVIGGGTGTYQILSGLKKHPLDISAVISMADSGGSTGRLRKDLGMLPPGDLRQAIIALSDLPFAQKTLKEVFDFRFKSGKNLAGHSVGNILLAALTQITGSIDKATEEAARILNVNGKVYPATLDKCSLVAILKDSSKIYGQAKITRRKERTSIPIKRVYLTPKATVHKKARTAILDSAAIILGPGDLFTSIIPVLLTIGTPEAVRKSKAKVIYVTNLVNKRSETRGFKASDFVRQIEYYLGKSPDAVVVNKPNKKNGIEIMKWYKKHGSRPVVNDLDPKKYKIKSGDFFAKSTFLRHDPDKLAKVIMGVI